jgi:response regulator RpfG family c-di-GMP phosphodiesterase
LPVVTAPARFDAKTRVLVVDDDEQVRRSLAPLLRRSGYHVHGVGCAVAALEALAGGDFAVMLCDVRMPGTDGIELLQQAMSLDPHLAVVMLSGLNDALTAREAFTRGAADYLIKPVQIDVLGRALDEALRRRTLLIERRWVGEPRPDGVVAQLSDAAQKQQVLRALSVTMAESLVNAMEAKDSYLRGHSRRVAELAAATAEELALDAGTVRAVHLAGRLHDVGKIGVREAVLNKPGALTVDEYEHVKEHVRVGMEILAPLCHLGPVLDFVHDHHERWDGMGYPRGRRGDAITLGGRIIAGADVFDAITSERAYRAAMPAGEALDYLSCGWSGTLLDPRVFDALSRVVRRRELRVLAGGRAERS